MDIFAGEGSEGYALVVGDGLPGHVSVQADVEMDVSWFGDAELGDEALLAAAWADAIEAKASGLLGVRDEVGLQRAQRRAARRVLADEAGQAAVLAVVA